MKTIELLAHNVATLVNEKFNGSQTQLARAAKVDQKTINRMVNQTNAAGIDNLEKVARAAGMTSAELLSPNFGRDKVTPDQITGTEYEIVLLMRKLGSPEQRTALLHEAERLAAGEAPLEQLDYLLMQALRAIEPARRLEAYHTARHALGTMDLPPPDASPAPDEAAVPPSARSTAKPKRSQRTRS